MMTTWRDCLLFDHEMQGDAFQWFDRWLKA